MPIGFSLEHFGKVWRGADVLAESHVLAVEIDHGSFPSADHQSFTRCLKVVPGVNFGLLPEEILMKPPVIRLRPVRAAALVFSKVQKPFNLTTPNRAPRSE